MNELSIIIELAKVAPTIFIIIVLWKVGIIKFGNGKNGNGGNGYQAQIDILEDHARTANQEVGKIQKDIVSIKEDIAFIRGKLEK